MRNGKKRANDEVPNWQPISTLPMFAFIIDGMLREDQEQYKNLLEAKDKPHVLDDATVDRVISVYNTHLEDASIFDEQLSRWKKGKQTSSQREEVERLTQQVEQLRKVCQQILALAAELRKGTIDRILEKSDIELALDVLTGKIKPPWE